MPDQLPSSILNPTLSDDSLFALNIDTKRRFEAMNETFQQPISMPDYSIPQSSLTDNSLTKGTIGEALFNPDPKIARDAQNAIQSRMDGLATKSNIGVPEFFHWDKSMDKYLNKTYGYNPYISMADNEDFYYENQYLTKSVVGKLLANTGKGLTRFTTGVGLKLVQTLGQTAGLLWNGVQEIIEASGGPQNNAMADVADNGLARWAMHAEEYLKNTNTLTVFKPSDWEDKGFFEKLRSGAFWSDEIADGAAFMGEMVLSTYLLGGLGKLGGLSKLGATSINTASKLGKGGKALDWGIKALTGANDISGIGRWAFLTASESAMESAEGYKNHKEKLQIERSLGKNNYTDDQIVKLAGDVASSQFKDNMLILGLSSSFENRFIFEPLFGKAGRAVAGKSWRSRIGISSSTKSVDDLARAEMKKYNYKTLLGKLSDWKNPNSRLNFYGKRFGKATLAEGYWEENAQLATERLSVNEAYNTGDFLERKYELARKTLGQAASTLPKWTGVPGSEVTDKVADTAIGLGSVIGVLGTGIIAKAAGGDRNILVEDKDKPGEFKKQKNGWFEGERRKIDRTAQEAINIYEKGRREFLSFNDIYEKTADQLDQDGNVVKKGEVIKDEFGNPVIDIEKAKGVLDGIYNMSDKFDVLDKVEDPLQKKHLQDRAIGTFVLAAKSVGLFEKSLEAFSNLDKIDAKQLEELGFDPNTIVDHKWMQESLKETGEVYDKTYKTSQVPKKGQTERDEDTRKHTLFVSRVTANSAKRIAKEYEKAYREVLADTVDIDNLEEYNMDIQQVNLTLLQKQKLEQFKKTRDLKDDFFAEHIKAQEEKIDNKLAELTTSLAKWDSLNMDQFGEGRLGISPLGIRYSKERYAHLKSTERVKLDNIDASFTPIHPNWKVPVDLFRDKVAEEQERLAAIDDEIDSVPRAKEIRTSISELDLQLLQDHKDVLKQGELLNTLAQYEYLAEQLSHPENGIANMIAYQKYIDTIKERDIKEDEKEKKEIETKIKNYSIVPVTEDDVTTFDVLDKDNKIIGNFETEDEAKAKIEELTKDIPEKKPTKVPEEDKKLTYEELRELVLEILKAKMRQFGMPEKEDEEVLKLVPGLITDEASRKDLSDEELAALTAYVEAYNERLAKQILAPEETLDTKFEEIRKKLDSLAEKFINQGKTQGEAEDLALNSITEEERQVLRDSYNKSVEEEKAKKTGEPENISQPIELTINPTPKEEKKEEPPVPPPSGVPGKSTGDLYDEVKHAYDIWEKALLNESSFKEEADKENLVNANNEINRRIDNAKNTGKITFVTSNPIELNPGNSLITVGDDVKLLRHNFLNKLHSGQIDKNKIKLSLQISEDGNLYGKITDNNGKIIYFDKNANRVKEGMFLSIYIDTDLYSGEHLPKRRSEVVKFKVKTEEGEKDQEFSPLSSNPVILNEVFLKDGKPRTDILDILKARAKKENVLASIDFITQGLLVREGSTNKYDEFPGVLPTRTIEELQKNGELVEPIGSIKIADDQVAGIFQKKQRINFSLWRNVNDHEQGSEIVEFRPVPLGEVQTSDGKNLMESLQIDVNGTKMSIFEAGVQGILPSSPRVIYTLKNLLRPDKFIVLNLGNTVMIINAVKFTKFLKTGNITLEELKKLTTLDDIKNSELNIFKSDYDKNSSEEMVDGILIDNKYMDFINKNVRTSVLSVKKEPNSMGVARINKRLVVTLDKNITDMLKEENQVDITGKTTVIPVDDIAAPLDIEKVFEESKDINPDDISKGITKNNC